MEESGKQLALSFAPDMAHVILLLQPGVGLETRTFSDYDNFNQCLQGILSIFNDHMKRIRPNMPPIPYNPANLFNFIDAFVVFNCLIHRTSTNTYCAYSKDWIKEKLYVFMTQNYSQ